MGEEQLFKHWLMHLQQSKLFVYWQRTDLVLNVNFATKEQDREGRYNSSISQKYFVGLNLKNKKSQLILSLIYVNHPASISPLLKTWFF